MAFRSLSKKEGLCTDQILWGLSIGLWCKTLLICPMDLDDIWIKTHFTGHRRGIQLVRYANIGSWWRIDATHGNGQTGYPVAEALLNGTTTRVEQRAKNGAKRRTLKNWESSQLNAAIRKRMLDFLNYISFPFEEGEPKTCFERIKSNRALSRRNGHHIYIFPDGAKFWEKTIES